MPQYIEQIRSLNTGKVTVVLAESPYPPELRDQGFLNTIRLINRRVGEFNREIRIATSLASGIWTRFRLQET